MGIIFYITARDAVPDQFPQFFQVYGVLSQQKLVLVVVEGVCLDAETRNGALGDILLLFVHVLPWVQFSEIFVVFGVRRVLIGALFVTTMVLTGFS